MSYLFCSFMTTYQLSFCLRIFAYCVHSVCFCWLSSLMCRERICLGSLFITTRPIFFGGNSGFHLLSQCNYRGSFNFKVSWFGNKIKHMVTLFINQSPSSIVDLCEADLLNEGHLVGTVQPRDGSLQMRCKSLVYPRCYPKRRVP